MNQLSRAQSTSKNQDKDQLASNSSNSFSNSESLSDSYSDSKEREERKSLSTPDSFVPSSSSPSSSSSSSSSSFPPIVSDSEPSKIVDYVLEDVTDEECGDWKTKGKNVSSTTVLFSTVIDSKDSKFELGTTFMNTSCVIGWIKGSEGYLLHLVVNVEGREHVTFVGTTTASIQNCFQIYKESLNEVTFEASLVNLRTNAVHSFNFSSHPDDRSQNTFLSRIITKLFPPEKKNILFSTILSEKTSYLEIVARNSLKGYVKIYLEGTKDYIVSLSAYFQGTVIFKRKNMVISDKKIRVVNIRERDLQFIEFSLCARSPNSTYCSHYMFPHRSQSTELNETNYEHLH